MPNKIQIVIREATVMTGNNVTPTATVKAIVNGEERINAATGVGPVDAALTAIVNILGDHEIKLDNFTVQGVCGDSDSNAEVTIVVRDGKQQRDSACVKDPDIVMAAVNAFVEAANKLLSGN